MSILENARITAEKSPFLVNMLKNAPRLFVMFQYVFIYNRLTNGEKSCII